MAEIRIPPVLRAEAAGSRTVTVEATNVRDALSALIAQHPALEARVLPDGVLPTFLNVFVDLNTASTFLSRGSVSRYPLCNPSAAAVALMIHLRTPSGVSETSAMAMIARAIGSISTAS